MASAVLASSAAFTGFAGLNFEVCRSDSDCKGIANAAQISPSLHVAHPPPADRASADLKNIDPAHPLACGTTGKFVIILDRKWLVRHAQSSPSSTQRSVLLSTIFLVVPFSELLEIIVRVQMLVPPHELVLSSPLLRPPVSLTKKIACVTLGLKGVPLVQTVPPLKRDALNFKALPNRSA